MNVPVGDTPSSHEGSEAPFLGIAPLISADALLKLSHLSQTCLPAHIRPDIVSPKRVNGWMLVGWIPARDVPQKLRHLVPPESPCVCVFRNNHTEICFWLALSWREVDAFRPSAPRSQAAP